MVEDTELSIREVGHELADPRLAPGEVEREGARAEESVVMPGGVPTQLDTQSRDQLVECERLRKVVVRSEPEAPQLGRQVGARGHDDDGNVRLAQLELAEDREP